MKRRAALAVISAGLIAPVQPALASPADAMAEADRYAQGYLAGFEQGYDRGRGNGISIGFQEGWEIGEPQGYERATLRAAPSAVVVGAFYDFLGRLTTLDEPITVSRSHEVYAILDAFTAWAKDRGLDIDKADVEHWQRRLTD